MSRLFDPEVTLERLPVECGSCNWKGKRMSGKLVYCPKCGSLAAFQPLPTHL